jgi:hypothetical protein
VRDASQQGQNALFFRLAFLYHVVYEIEGQAKNKNEEQGNEAKEV